MSPLTWCGFLAAAGAGAVSRYLLGRYLNRRAGGTLPWGTAVVNLVGSAVLGLVTGMGLHHGLPAPARVILGTGFCGAFTTFSAFSYETVLMIEEGEVAAGLGNALGTLVACGLAAGAGLGLATL